MEETDMCYPTPAVRAVQQAISNVANGRNGTSSVVFDVPLFSRSICFWTHVDYPDAGVTPLIVRRESDSQAHVGAQIHRVANPPSRCAFQRRSMK
jgi:hypothetical protein